MSRRVVTAARFVERRNENLFEIFVRELLKIAAVSVLMVKSAVRLEDFSSGRRVRSVGVLRLNRALGVGRRAEKRRFCQYY